MAEVKNVQINVDTKSAVDAMENLSKATHDVSASFEEVYGELQPLTTRMGEAEDRLYELANAGQTATQEYQDLLNTVANYRRVQIQTDMAVDAASSTFATKLGGALGGVTAGFSIAQGAMGAFGVESEDLEKQLLKVQSAMAIAEGVRGFKEAIPSIKAFGNAMKAAIGSTGIGLLIVALGTIYAYWDDIKAAVSGVSDEQAKLNAKTQANLIAEQAKYDSLTSQDNILKLQGKSERDILNLKAQQIKAVIKATEAQLIQDEATKKAQVEAAKRNYDILKLVTKVGIETSVVAFRALAAPIDLVLETANAVADALGFDKITTTNLNKEISKLTETASKGLTKFIFDPEAVENEGNKTIQATKDKLASLKNEAAGFQLSLNDLNKKPVDNAGKETVKAAIEMVNAFDEAALDINEIDNKVFEDMKARDAEELAQMEAHNAELIEAEKQLQLDLSAAAWQGKEDRVKTALAEQQQKEAIQKQNIDFALQGIAIVKDLFEKNKNVQRAAIIAESALGIAKMIISNKTANLGALATPQAIATSGLSAAPVIAANNISTGLGIAANILATGKALQALGGGSAPSAGGVGGGSGAGGGGSMSPSFNVVGNSGMNQLAQIQQTPIQAYVVSGEVTSAQALDRNRIKNATL